MTMSKIDFERIAETIRPLATTAVAMTEARDSLTEPEFWDGYKFGITDLTLTLSARLEISHPRFDRDRFIRACGLEDTADGIKALRIEEPQRYLTGEDRD